MSTVLMVSSFWHPRGGDTTCMFSMVRGLEARGHTVVPFAMRHPDNLPSVWESHFPSALGVPEARPPELYWRAAQAMWSPLAARALRGLLAQVRPDVAHVHHLHRHLTPSVLVPLHEAGIPVVWTVHDYELVCPNGQLYADGAPCERCLGHRYQEAVRHRCKHDSLAESAAVAAEKALHHRLDAFRHVDRFLCPSRFLADRLLRFGLDPARLVHLPNGVEPPPPPAPAPAARWLYAGRITAEKGVRDLLAAARLLPEHPLTVCGDGPLLAELRASAPAHVTFTGALSPVEVRRRLAHADVVVVPSRWPENDPYAVLEAQAAGRAVVASAIGGIPEQVTDDVDGVLVPPAQPPALAAAVRALLADPARRTRLGEAAAARITRTRSLARWMDQVEATYRQLR